MAIGTTTFHSFRFRDRYVRILFLNTIMVIDSIGGGGGGGDSSCIIGGYIET